MIKSIFKTIEKHCQQIYENCHNSSDIISVLFTSFNIEKFGIYVIAKAEIINENIKTCQ